MPERYRGHHLVEDGEFLKRARELAPRIRAAASEIESRRELPTELARSLAEQGMFHLLVPRSLGGAALPLPIYLPIIEVLAEADGSTGWCVNQAAVFATLCDQLPFEVAKEIWGDPYGVVANGPPVRAEARNVEDGYRLTGEWRFSSGYWHASWLAGVAPVVAERPEPGARRAFRILLFPRSSARMVEGWDVRGMRGTGSHHFAVRDLFVPRERSFPARDPSRDRGRVSIQLLFASGFAAVALGIARSAIDLVVELAEGKRPYLSGTVLRHEPSVQSETARAEAIYRSARAFLFEAAGELWEELSTIGELSRDRRARLRLAATHAMRQASEAVDRVYGLAGGDAIFADHPLQRHFQDIHVLTQHVQARQTHYEAVGRQLLGLDPESIFI